MCGYTWRYQHLPPFSSTWDSKSMSGLASWHHSRLQSFMSKVLNHKISFVMECIISLFIAPTINKQYQRIQIPHTYTTLFLVIWQLLVMFNLCSLRVNSNSHNMNNYTYFVVDILYFSCEIFLDNPRNDCTYQQDL